MTFIKTSQKFGQWSDAGANTMYGLGFSDELDLVKFISAFNGIKEATSQMAHEELEIMPQNDTLVLKPLNQVDSEMKANQNSNPSSSCSGPNSLEQLRYENDRLTVALTQSRNNAKKWEVELQTLRNNSLRLNAALVESASNVKQWKEQLSSLKEENVMLKRKLAELEQSAGNSGHFQNQMMEVMEKLQMTEILVENLNKELASYQLRIEEISGVDGHRQILTKIQAVEEENFCLKKDLLNLSHELEIVSYGANADQELLNLQQQLSVKLNEMYVLNDRLAELLQ